LGSRHAFLNSAQSLENVWARLAGEPLQMRFYRMI